MENKKGKMFTSVSIGAATVWFSTHCGAGFASGTQELTYFASHSWYGWLFPILSIFIIGINYYVGAQAVFLTGKQSFGEWALDIYKPMGLVGRTLLDISVIVTTLAATGACISAGANLLFQNVKLPMILGTLIMFVIIGGLSIFGADLVRKNAMIMTVAIIAIVILIVIIGVAKFAPNLGALAAENYMNPTAPKWGITASGQTTPASFGNSLLWALTYAGFQMAIVGGTVAAFFGAKNYREAKGFAITGIILNTIMLSGVCLLLTLGMPELFANEEARTLPTLYMVQQLNLGALNVVYPILLMLALITTGVGFCFAMVTRFGVYFYKERNGKKNTRIVNVLICLITLIFCWGIAQLGLIWVVQTAYRYLGIYNWIAIIIPFCLFGWKNLKRLKIEKGIAA